MGPPNFLRQVWRAVGHLGTLTWLLPIMGAAAMSVWSALTGHSGPMIAYVALGTFAILLIVIPRLLSLGHRIIGPQLIAAELRKATDAPAAGMTAVRLVVKNKGSKLTGLVATLARTDPPLNGYPAQINLPLTLVTKTRLDAFRNNGQTLPHMPFNLNAGAEKHIELCWLGTRNSLEGHITHEAGQADFLIHPGYTFHIEISGEARSFKFVARLFLLNEETGEWDCELLSP